jgi:hypothetical protein
MWANSQSKGFDFLSINVGPSRLLPPSSLTPTFPSLAYNLDDFYVNDSIMWWPRISVFFSLLLLPPMYNRVKGRMAFLVSQWKKIQDCPL